MKRKGKGREGRGGERKKGGEGKGRRKGGETICIFSYKRFFFPSHCATRNSGWGTEEVLINKHVENNMSFLRGLYSII